MTAFVTSVHLERVDGYLDDTREHHLARADAILNRIQGESLGRRTRDLPFRLSGIDEIVRSYQRDGHRRFSCKLTSSPGMGFIESASKPHTWYPSPSRTKMAITIILPTVKSPWVRRTVTIQLIPVRII